MPDQYSVVQICRVRRKHDIRIVGEGRITVLDGQIHDNRPMTSRLQLWNEPTPAPSAMPGPVHKDKRAHDGVPGSMPEQ